MGESRCELLESSSKMFYVIFHQETDPKVKKLFYEIIYCKCGAQKRPVLQGLMHINRNKQRFLKYGALLLSTLLFYLLQNSFKVIQFYSSL